MKKSYEELEQENLKLKTALTACKNIVRNQERKNRLEKLISTISRQFIKCRVEETDDLVYSSLARIGEFTGVDRSYLFLYDHDKDTASCTHEWCKEGISCQKDNLQQFSNKNFPWWTEKILNNEVIHLKTLDDLPSFAQQERKILDVQSIRSLLVVPVLHANTPMGFIGFDSVVNEKSWSKDDILMLSLMADIIAGHFNRVQSSISLRKSEEKYRLLMDSTEDAVLVADEFGTLHFVNPSACRDYNLPGDQLIGKNIFDLYNKQFATEVLNDVRQVISSGKPIKKEYFFYYNSSERWYDVRMKPLIADDSAPSRVMIFANDVHEHKMNELRLEQLNQQIHNYNYSLEKVVQKRTRENDELININRAIIEASGALLISTNKDGIIESFNPMAEKTLGYKAEEVVGKKPVVDLYDAEELNEIVKMAEKKAGRVFRSSFEAVVFFNENNSRPVSEVTYVSKKGKKTPVLLSVTRVDSPEEANLRYVGVAMDITMQKRAANALKLQNELKSRFVSMASHEFRTPLATILMAADSLDSYFPKMTGQEIHHKLGRIKSNVEFLKKVMERVLDLSHIESGRMNMKTRQDDFAGFLKKNVLEVSRYSKTGHEFNINIGNDRVECLFDPQMMKQVISNLLSNAIKYSGDGSEISVYLQMEKGKIRFSITDQGIGISEDDAERIFDPFHRGGNVSNIRGTGLGLSLAREFVRLHGGDISFESNENGGTTFYVYFPA